MSLDDLIVRISSLSINSTTETLPSSVDFYRLGLGLYRASQLDSSSRGRVKESFDHFVKRLTPRYIGNILQTLNKGFETVLRKRDVRDVETATESICGLYGDTPSICAAGFSAELCRNCSSAYELLGSSSDKNTALRRSLLLCLSSILRNGVIEDKGKDEETKLRCVMEAVQAMTENDRNTCLGDMVSLEVQVHGPTRGLTGLVRARFTESPQREYLVLMIESSPQEGDDRKAVGKAVRQEKKPPDTRPKQQVVLDPRTEIDRRIQQVKDVLPNLGDGYVETALSSFHGDVTQTVAALLEGEGNPASLPPALQMLDNSLPGRRKDSLQQTNASQREDEEARRITKERVVQMERQQETEAYALTAVHNEYNDDYDDQYDGMDGGEALGGTGGTYDDVDLDTIRMYNRVTRDAEREDAFWVSYSFSAVARECPFLLSVH